MTNIPGDEMTKAGINFEEAVRQTLDFPGDVDAFRLRAPAGEAVRIEVDSGQSSTLRPQIALLDADGDTIRTSLDENADGLHYLIYEMPPEPVFLQVSDAGGSATGEYRLSVEGSLGTITVEATTDGAYDFDRFRTVLEAGRAYRAEVFGNTINTLTVDSPDIVSLSEAIFGPVASRFDVGFTARGDGRDFLLRGAKIDERFSDAEDYTLELTEVFDDAPDGPSTRASLGLGETYRGRFETTADRDWIGLEIAPGTSVQLSGDLGDTSNSLTVVAVDRATGALAQPVVTTPFILGGEKSQTVAAEPGVDYFAVASIRTDVQVNQSPAYDLTTIALPGDVASGPSTGLSLAAEGTVQSFFEVPGDVDWIAVETTPGQAYGYDVGAQNRVTSQIVRIDTQTGAFLGASVAGEDSGFGGSSGSFTAEAGIDYFVQIQAADSRAVGLWEARLYAVDDDVSDHTATLASVAPGAVFSGVAGVNDISAELNGPDVDYIRLDIPDGISHQVRVDGNVDAFVFSARDLPGQFSAGSLVLDNDDLPPFFRGTQTAVDFAEETAAGSSPSNPETAVVTRAPGEELYVAVLEGGLFDDISGNQPYEVSVAPLPTDTPDNESTTAVIVPNSTVFGIYDDGSDRDWVRIDIPVGESFALQQTGGGTFRVIAVDEATGEATERVPPTGQLLIDGGEIGQQGYVTGVAGKILYAQAEGDGTNGGTYSFRLLPREDDITEAYAGAPAIGLVEPDSSASTPEASVFLSADGDFTVSGSAVLFGRGGDGESALIAQGARNIALDGNIDRIDLPLGQAETTFQVVDGQLEIRTGGDVLVRVTGGLNQEVDLRFADGDATLAQTGAASFDLIGGAGSTLTVDSTAKTPSLTLGSNVSATAGGSAPQSPNGSVANVFLESDASFTIAYPADVFGRGGGQETVELTQAAQNVSLDGNIERVELPQDLSATTFQVVEGQLEISAGGTLLATFTSGLNQDVTLQFGNGEGTLSQTGAASFTLTGPGGEAQIGTTPTTPDIGFGEAVAVGASDDGETFDADTGNATFDFADGTYGVTVDNFSTGDVLDFADVGGNTGASFNVLGDSDQGDGEQAIEAVDPNDGSTVTVTLVGLSSAQDSNIFNQSSFEREFGSGSIVL